MVVGSSHLGPSFVYLLRIKRKMAQINYSCSVIGALYLFYVSEIFWNSNMFKNSIMMFCLNYLD